MYKNPTPLGSGGGDEVERSVNKPCNVFRAMVIKIEPQEVEAARLPEASVSIEHMREIGRHERTIPMRVTIVSTGATSRARLSPHEERKKKWHCMLHCTVSQIKCCEPFSLPEQMDRKPKIPRPSCARGNGYSE